MGEALVRVFYPDGTKEEIGDLAPSEPDPVQSASIPRPRRNLGFTAGTRNAWTRQVDAFLLAQQYKLPRLIRPRNHFFHVGPMASERDVQEDCPECGGALCRSGVCPHCGHDTHVPDPIAVVKYGNPQPPLE